MSGIGKRMVEVQLAFVFLTRLPMGRLPENTPPLSHAAWAFPLVGLVVGAVSGVVFLAASTFTTGLAAAALAITTGVLLTGALHEDGLADVADGFGGGATRDQKLDIMRDSRIGSYGVVALILALAVIAASMAEAPQTLGTLLTFAAIGATSRAAMLVPMACLAPARTEGLGHGALLSLGPVFWTGIGIAAFMALITQVFFFPTAALTVVAVLWLAKKQIGGQTGDVLGATQKITECLLWLAATSTLATT